MIFLLCGLTTAALASTDSDGEGSSLNRIINLSSKSKELDGVSPVRAAALRELGRGLGMRAGLEDESAKIVKEIETEKINLDRKFNFGTMTFPTGALPPVISEAKDVISVMDFSMRVAGKVYRIESPARFIPVNWRDYLYLGLSASADPLVNEAQRSIYPRDSNESRYWEKVVKEGYAEGAKQARSIFHVNLSRLERDFNGMQLYYELAARGLVSVPQIATATESVKRPDPNTIIIGESLIRITDQPKFDGDATRWSTRK